MAVSLLVANFLQAQGYTVHLTRHDDATLTLDERTTRANMIHNGFLFLSIHANSSYNLAATGLETFYLGQDKLHEGFSELSSELMATVGNHRMNLCQESKKLAFAVHKAVFSAGSTLQPTMVDRSIKQAAMQVFVGANMPSILVELGFLSNAHEARLLAQQEYQHKLAQGIVAGIKNYCESCNHAD